MCLLRRYILGQCNIISYTSTSIYNISDIFFTNLKFVNVFWKLFSNIIITKHHVSFTNLMLTVVCVYALPPVGFFRLHDIRINDLLLWTFSECFCQVPSSLSPNLSYFTSKDENSSQPLTGEKTIWYVWNPSKRWYILI